MNKYVAWRGIRFQKPTSGTNLLSMIFRVIMALYLFESAAACIQMFTDIPVVVTVIVWFILVTQIGEEQRSILNRRQVDVLGYAVLLLGSMYRLGGHPSFFTLAAIVAYWAVVVLAKHRSK